MCAGAGVLLLVLALSAPSPLLGQTTSVQLLFDDGGFLRDRRTVTVTLTDDRGAVPPDTAAVQQADRIHFLYRPAGDWTLKDDALATLRKIAVQQNQLRIRPVETSLLQQNGVVTAARATYPRDQIDWHQPFTFTHKVGTSAPLSLPEVYSMGYATLRRPYDQGRRLLKQGRFRQALDTLSVFFGKDPSSYAFVSDAKKTLDKAAQAIMDQETKMFEQIREDVITSPSPQSLKRIPAFRTHLDTVRTLLAPYMKARPEAGASVQEQIARLDTSAATLYDNAYETYRQQTIRVFLEDPFRRAKPALFIEGLVQLLLAPDSPVAVSGRLPTTLPDGPHYDDVRQALRKHEWTSDFQAVLSVVNTNLQQHNRLFGETVFKSLQVAQTSASQPYYEILAALNAKAGGNDSQFEEHWTRALTTCTDFDLFRTLQHWRVAARTAPSSDSVAAHVEAAHRLLSDDRPEAAQRQLDQGRQHASDYPPFLYEQGRLHEARGDTAAAQEHFDRARSADPTYVVPEVATLRLLLARNQSEEALSRADTALQSAPYWLVYFAKARALKQLERYDEAIDVLRGECEQRNDKSYALYVLLAEIYAERGAWKGAAWAVQKADAYEPLRTDFIPRGDAVRERVKAAEEASLEGDYRDPAASGP